MISQTNVSRNNAMNKKPFEKTPIDVENDFISSKKKPRIQGHALPNDMIPHQESSNSESDIDYFDEESLVALNQQMNNDFHKKRIYYIKDVHDFETNKIIEDAEDIILSLDHPVVILIDNCNGKEDSNYLKKSYLSAQSMMK